MNWWWLVLTVIAAPMVVVGAYLVLAERVPPPAALWTMHPADDPAPIRARCLGWGYLALGGAFLVWVAGYLASLGGIAETLTLAAVSIGLLVASIMLHRKAFTPPKNLAGH